MSRPDDDPKLRVEFSKRELAEWFVGQDRNPDVFHGREIVRAQQLPSGRGTLIVQGRWKGKMGPRILQLGQPADPYPPADGSGYFPPLPFMNGRCGIIDVTGALLWTDVIGQSRQLAAVVEYGSGSAVNVVYMDWLAGVYNIPPCEYVRVGALAWGQNWGGDIETTFLATAGLASGFFDGAHVPTITGEYAMTAATNMSLKVPNGARAVDVVAYTNGAFPSGVITVAGAASFKRDYGTPSFVPGWGPVLLQPYEANQLYVSVDSNMDCRLTYYVEM